MSSEVPAAGAADQPASPTNSTAPASTPTDAAASLEQRLALVRGDAITVLVGEECKPFIVHRDLICHFSPFFRAACNGPWIESEGTVLLPEDEPDSFDVYLKWLYSGSIIFREDSRFFLAYILGDKLLDDCFKNAFMDKFISEKFCYSILNRSGFDFIYNYTTELSPMQSTQEVQEAR